MQENITLYYRAGNSDKVYAVQLVETPEGWLVNTQNGRRGGTMMPRTKTPEPVSYEEAKALYDKQVKAKLKEGYTPGEDGTVYTQTSLEDRFTGIVPQLLNPITEAELEQYFQDDNWVMQEKFDGERGLNQKSAQVIGINRKGLQRGLAETIVSDMNRLPEKTLVDGELMGDVQMVFDLLELAGKDLRQRGYLARMEQAEALLADYPYLKVVYTAKTEAEKRALFAKVRAACGEGVVFKRKDAISEPGRPASGGSWVKYKFVESATVIVDGANKGKRSVRMLLKDADGNHVPVGNVTIPSNHEIPAKGALVEVGYLYAYPGGSLFQPVYHGVRQDLDADDCVLTQLKYKQGTEEAA